MKNGRKQLAARFAPEEKFNLIAKREAAFRGEQDLKFEQLKARLLRKLLDDAIQPELNAPLRRAANEAAALAWATPFPLLFFPALLEEKARRARLQLQKQGYVRLRSETLLVEAA